MASRRCLHLRPAGRTIVRVLPSDGLSTDRPPSDRPPSDRPLASAPPGTPLPDNRAELPPVIRRTEVVAFALVSLLVICVVAVLYAAKAFFLPITMAFIIGTMLSPAAGFLERYRIHRSLGAVLIVAAVGATVTFMIGLISAPLMEWSSRLPELGAILREKLHVFDRPLALWQELQGLVGGSDALGSFQLPKFEWVQPTLEFLSPTFAEFLLFIATLILFIASWKDLRRALVMTFGGRTARLRRERPCLGIATGPVIARGGQRFRSRQNRQSEAADDRIGRLWRDHSRRLGGSQGTERPLCQRQGDHSYGQPESLGHVGRGMCRVSTRPKKTP